jgi:F0F1-type ATP synthase membrane subunit b/b'
MANSSAAVRQVVQSNPEHATPAKEDTGLPGPSLSYFAEQFGCLLNEKRDLASQLSKALDENAALNRRYEQTCAEFDAERIQFSSEIANLRSQLTSRLQSILAVKEKLMREEFEIKFQELTLEVKQERRRYRNAIEEMKRQIASCICRARNR